MPYIKKYRRKLIDKFLDGLIITLVNVTDSGKRNNGDVTYAIYKILKQIYQDGHWETKANALKVVDSAIDEYKKNILRPYEDKKKKENGDI